MAGFLRGCGVLLETARSLSKELDGHREIDGRGRHVDVSKIRRQKRESGLDIGPFPVPRDEAMDRKGGTQVVQSRRMSVMLTADGGAMKRAGKGVLKTSQGDGLPGCSREEGG